MVENINNRESESFKMLLRTMDNASNFANYQDQKCLIATNL